MFGNCGEEIRSGKMLEGKKGTTEIDLTNNKNKMEDGPIVSGSYNGFSVFPLTKCKQTPPTQRKGI
jgi:hypothetical protein